MSEPSVLAARHDVSHGVSSRTVHTFIRMWAVAHIIHLCAANQSRLDTPWNVLAVVSALALILRPGSGRWLVVLAGSQLADLVAEMPFSPDHWLLLGFVNVALLISLVSSRTWDTAGIRLGLPAVRVLVLVAYSFAAMSKYNTTFLDPLTSCATAIADTASYGIASKLGVPTVWVVSVIVTETMIPLLLAMPKTRRHGVRIGLAFHFMLSASPAFAVIDFTSALFALFLLFLSEQDLDRVMARIRAVTDRSAIVRDARRVPWATAVVAFVAFGLLGHLSLRVAGALLLVGSELYLLIVLLGALWSWPQRGAVRPIGRLRPVFAPVVVLLVIWALNPYLGLRTTSSFTMFSSIRTEGIAPNHLFMPSLRLVDWQDELVIIESSNDPSISSGDPGHLGIPLLALRQVAMTNPGLEVTGTLHGQRVVFGPEEGQRRFEPVDGWLQRYPHFRPVAVTDDPFCSVS